MGFRNRVAVFTLWGWNYFHKDRPIRIIALVHADLLIARVSGDSAETHDEQLPGRRSRAVPRR